MLLRLKRAFLEVLSWSAVRFFDLFNIVIQDGFEVIGSLLIFLNSVYFSSTDSDFRETIHGIDVKASHTLITAVFFQA